MRAAKLASVVGTSAVLLCALASASGAQRAPIVRVYSTNGAYTLSTTSYVTPVVEVSENAYVFAVSMDLDGQIQVLQPDFPGISVKMLANKRVRLPNFFVGFSQSDRSRSYSSAAYANGYSGDGDMDATRGTVIALASRAPFKLDLISSDGDWDMTTLRRLMDNRTPQMAAQALANYLGAKDEPIGRDYMRFGGGRDYYSGYSYANGYYSGCDLYGSAYSTALAGRYLYVQSTIAQLQARGQRASIGYDMCGLPFVIFRGSSAAFGGARPPTPRDTGTIRDKRPHFPDATDRQAGDRQAQRRVPQGVFPIPQRAELPQMGDVTIKAPKGRRSEPVTFLNGYQPGVMAAPQGRAPVERPSTPRNEPAAAATGSFPVRESRPEPPRVYTPPPTRAEPPPAAPAPVTRERPSTPAPSPPRVAPTVTNSPPSRR